MVSAVRLSRQAVGCRSAGRQRRQRAGGGGGGGGEGGEVEGRREIKMAARASGAEPPTRTTLLLAVIKGKRGEN